MIKLFKIKSLFLLAILLLFAANSFAQLDPRFGTVGLQGAQHLGNSGLQWYRDWQDSYLPENYPPPSKNKIWTVGKIDYRTDGLGMDYRWMILDLLENTDPEFLQSFLNLSLAIAENIFYPLINNYWQENVAGLEDSLENVLDGQTISEMVLRVKYRARFTNTSIDFQDFLPEFQINVSDSIINFTTQISIDWLTHIYVEAYVLNPNPFHWGYIWKDMGDADGTFHTNLLISGDIGLHGKASERRLQIDTIKVDSKTESEIDWKALGIGFTWETLSNSVENLIDDQLESSLSEQLNSDSLFAPYFFSEIFKSLFPNNEVPTQQAILDTIFNYEKPYIRRVIRPEDFTSQYWSIGYEPNFFPYMNPQQYADYFVKYYRFIKLHDPDAKFLGPSILLTDLMEQPEQLVFSYIPPMLWGFLAGVEEEFSDLVRSYFQKGDSRKWFSQFVENLPPDVQIDVVDLHVFPLATRFSDIDWDSVVARIDSFSVFARQLTGAGKIWVTEFGNIDHRRSESEAVAICQNLCDYFKDNTVGISKWFWYLSLGHSPFYDTDFSPEPPISALLNSDLSLTRIGRAYLNRADNSPPVMIYAPQANGTVVMANTLTFSWQEALEMDTGIQDYQLQVKSANSDTAELEIWVGDTLSAKVNGFDGKIVSARVRAKNGAGLIGDWSDWSQPVKVLPNRFIPDESKELSKDKSDSSAIADTLIAAAKKSEAENFNSAGENAIKLVKTFPNPFNSQITIQYQLSKSSHVKIAIYNSLGQHVRTLIEEEQAEGNYTVRWDGSGRSGFPMNSGIYFCSLETGGKKETVKLLLLR